MRFSDHKVLRIVPPCSMQRETGSIGGTKTDFPDGDLVENTLESGDESFARMGRNNCWHDMD